MMSKACFLVWATNSPFWKWNVWAMNRCTPVARRLSQKVSVSRTSRRGVMVMQDWMPAL